MTKDKASEIQIRAMSRATTNMPPAPDLTPPILEENKYKARLAIALSKELKSELQMERDKVRIFEYLLLRIGPLIGLFIPLKHFL